MFDILKDITVGSFLRRRSLSRKYLMLHTHRVVMVCYAKESTHGATKRTGSLFPS